MWYKNAAHQGVSGSSMRLTTLAAGGRFMADREVTAQAALYQCKSCKGDYPAGAFYASNMTRCKECVKASVRANRADKLDYYRSYDRMRYREDPHRKENARRCSESAVGQAAKARATARSKENAPHKWAARRAVSNAVRDGKLTRGTECFFCGKGDKLQAHHHDYSKPLDVFWLCPPCHGKLHTINGDFHRNKPTGAS